MIDGTNAGQSGLLTRITEWVWNNGLLAGGVLASCSFGS